VHYVTILHGLLTVNDSNTCYILVKIVIVCTFEKLIFKNTYVHFFKQEMCFDYTVLRGKILQDSKISVTYSARTSRPWITTV